MSMLKRHAVLSPAGDSLRLYGRGSKRRLALLVCPVAFVLIGCGVALLQMEGGGLPAAAFFAGLVVFLGWTWTHWFLGISELDGGARVVRHGGEEVPFDSISGVRISRRQLTGHRNLAIEVFYVALLFRDSPKTLEIVLDNNYKRAWKLSELAARVIGVPHIDSLGAECQERAPQSLDAPLATRVDPGMLEPESRPPRGARVAVAGDITTICWRRPRRLNGFVLALPLALGSLPAFALGLDRLATITVSIGGVLALLEALLGTDEKRSVEIDKDQLRLDDGARHRCLETQRIEVVRNEGTSVTLAGDDVALHCEVGTLDGARWLRREILLALARGGEAPTPRLPFR